MKYDPYHYERIGIPHSEFRDLQNLDNGRGWVDPIHAESKGISYKAWREYVDRKGK